MTDAYFYVNIPYHRPAPPSPLRLAQRWAGPLLLGTILAALAWRQDHQTQPLSEPTVPVTSVAAPAALQQPEYDGYTAAAQQAAAQTQANVTAQPAQAGTHPLLVFHNCSIPRMEVKKDRNELISGVASVSSCDEAKVTLWDSPR